MSYYKQRVADRILPLSINGIVPDAIREWQFTGNTTDHETAIETCELCGQEGLRYHFEIANPTTAARLDVGSECILRFQVPIFENGREVSASEAKKILASRVRQMRLESCVRALTKLAQSENNAILTHALEYYQRNKKLTPKFAFVVFWRLAAKGIDHDPTFFQIRLDSERFREDLRDMPSDRVHLFWKALTPSQRKKATELGHKDPSTA